MAAANERRLSVEHAKQVKEISGNGILAELSEGTVLCGLCQFAAFQSSYGLE